MNILICMPVAMGPPAFKDSKVSNCSNCDERIWITPGSLAGYAKDNPIPLCYKCAGEQISDDPNPIMVPPSEEILKEIKKELTPIEWMMFKEWVNDPEKVKKDLLGTIKKASKKTGKKKKD